VTSAVFRKSTINYKGFEYHLETAGLNLKIWRCTARLGCTARLHTNDFIKEKPQVLGEFGTHNHDGVGDKNKVEIIWCFLQVHRQIQYILCIV
jgi:hypothetical protein